MLVRGLGLGVVVVVVVFGLSVSAAGAAAPAGGVLAFGVNAVGQLGSSANIGTSNPNPTPTVVGLPGEVGPVTQVAAGGGHSLVLTASGQLYAFGFNEYGQLGSSADSGTNNPDPTPTLVGLPGAIGPVTQVAAGEDHSLAVTASGQLYAFGFNYYGQLGRSTNTSSGDPNPTPTVVTLAGEIGPVTRVAAGGNHSLAVTASGQLYAFGYNGYGGLGSATNSGTGTPTPTPTPVSLPGEIGPVTQIAAGGAHSLAVTASGQLYAFGLNGTGELGSVTNIGTSNPNPTPTLVTLPGEIGPVTQVAAGGNHSLAVTATGQLYAFGLNGTGELGSATNNGTNNPNPTPTPVSLPGEIGPVTQVAAGLNHSLAVTASGQLYAFGFNYYGQLGSSTNNGTDNPNPTPTLVSLASGTTIDTVAKGEAAQHSLVIVSDLAITTSALPAAQAGSSYQAALTATGGTAPLAWSQTGLPSGLSIDPQTGVLAGTPTSAGSSQVTTTATDSYGSQTSHTYTLTVNAAPPPIKAPPPPNCGAGQTATPSGCHTPPLLTNVHESHRDWRERNSRPSKHHPPTGTTFSYSLNEPATVTLAFTQKHPGRILAHRCQAPTKTNHNKPRCTRTLTIATLTAAGHAGANHLSFKGRVPRSNKLGPGTYTLVITAHAFGSTSRPRTLTFTILAVKPAGTVRPVIDTRTVAAAALAVALALPAGAAAALTIPPIHEPFTPLPCTGKPAQRTTTEQEGCAEQQILKSDKRIDALDRAILGDLGSAAAKRRFIAAHTAWLAYRRAYCTSRSDVAPGGTEAPVVAATCAVALNAEHIKDLRAFADELSAE
jgi:alpha-tubulin suppressor-like RCC1 family protein/uncharacterized protein YecT (DUF1311 family)